MVTPDQSEEQNTGYPGEHLDNSEFPQDNQLPSVNLTPLGDKVVVRPMETPKKSESGRIIIPDTVRGSKCEGVIMAVGPGKREFNPAAGEWVTDPIDLEPGNIVVYAGEYAGNPVIVDGVEYQVLKQDDIFAART